MAEEGAQGQEGQGSEGQGGAGGGGGDWRTGLGPDLGNHSAFEPYKNEDLVQVPRAVAKAYVEQQRLIGVDKIAKPKETWGDEEWSQWYRDAGLEVPEKADGYQLSEVELPEGVEMDPDLVEHMKAAAREARVPAKQFDALFKGFMSKQIENFQQLEARATEAREKWHGEVKARYGAAFPAIQDMANRALAAAGGEKLVAKLRDVRADGVSLLDHPAWIDTMAALGKQMHEGDLLPGGKESRVTKTPEEAQGALAKFEVEHGKVLANPDAPGHKELTQRWNQLIDERDATRRAAEQAQGEKPGA